MVAIRAVAHFSIPVSDVAKSTQFYTDVVGCRHLSTMPNRQMVFLDAAGTCLIHSVQQSAPAALNAGSALDCSPRRPESSAETGAGRKPSVPQRVVGELTSKGSARRSRAIWSLRRVSSFK
jgi:catechol 2,3-dioxygenase-like lactoylglutathione lyase family enzyme